MTVTPQDLDVRLHTFAEGLLSPLAHDLELRATPRELSDDGGRITAVFASTDVRVVGAVKRGAVDPSVLSDKDKRDIEHRIQADHLRGDVRVEVSGDEVTVTTTRGRAVVRAKREGTVLSCTLSLSALGLGTIKGPLGVFKLKDAVHVRATTPTLAHPSG